MRTNLRRMLLPVALATGSTWIAGGCTDIYESAELAERDIRFGMPSQEFQTATLVHTEKLDTTFILTAPIIYRYDRSNRAKLLGGIHVDFYEDGRINSTLTADSGEVLRDGRKLYAYGNVVVETDSGMTLFTERLSWTEMDHKIRSDTTTTIVTEFEHLVGTGLVADDDLKSRTLFNPRGVSRRKNVRGEEQDTTAGAGKTGSDTVNPDSTAAPGSRDSVTVDPPITPAPAPFSPPDSSQGGDTGRKEKAASGGKSKK